MIDREKKDPHSKEQGDQTSDNYTLEESQLSIVGMEVFLPKPELRYVFLLDSAKVRRRYIDQPLERLQRLSVDAEMMHVLLPKSNIDLNVYKRQRWIHRIRRYTQHLNKIIYDIGIFYKSLAIIVCGKLDEAFNIFLANLNNKSQEIPAQARNLQRDLKRTLRDLKKEVKRNGL